MFEAKTEKKVTYILDVVTDEFIVPCRQWKNTTVFLYKYSLNTI